MMVMVCWGAIRTGRGTRNWKREWLQEQDREGKNGSGAGVQEAGTANAKRKGKKRPFSAYRIYRPRGVLSGAHAPRALTAGEMFPH
jgi:hypothetical protein